MSQQLHCGADLHEFAFWSDILPLKVCFSRRHLVLSSALYQALNSHSPTKNGRFQFAPRYGRLQHRAPQKNGSRLHDAGMYFICRDELNANDCFVDRLPSVFPADLWFVSFSFFAVKSVYFSHPEMPNFTGHKILSLQSSSSECI